MKTNYFLIPATVVMFFVVAFTPKYKGNIKLPKSITNEFAFIPAGMVVMNKDSFSVNYFYMSKTEICNKQYNEFLNDLKANNETEKLKIAAIDTNNWVKEYGKGGENYAKYYHSHIAYVNFPVINISKAGAELYCAWLTKKLNAENEGLEFTVRLPLEAEWLMACDPYNTNFPYSWQEPYLRDAKGNFLCNFRHFGEGNIYFDTVTKSFQIKNNAIEHLRSNNRQVDLTSPVISYLPSQLGLYNLNGNVAEFIAEGYAVGGGWNSSGYDIRNRSKVKTSGPSTEVGFRPVFMVKEKK